MKSGAKNPLHQKVMTDKLLKEAEGYLLLDNVSAAYNCYINATRIDPNCTAAIQGISHCEMLLKSSSINAPIVQSLSIPRMNAGQPPSESANAATRSSPLPIKPVNTAQTIANPEAAMASSSSSTMKAVNNLSSFAQPTAAACSSSSSSKPQAGIFSKLESMVAAASNAPEPIPTNSFLPQQKTSQQLISQIETFKKQLELLNLRIVTLKQDNERLRKDIELKGTPDSAPQKEKQQPAEKKARHGM